MKKARKNTLLACRALLFFVHLTFFPLFLPAQAPEPYGPLPSERQLEWQKMEYYAFVHFNMNTFTDQEWGFGNESPDLFNPTALDPRQWARIAKAAGMKGIIITAKHHDGFCLWPSAYTEHSVKNSPWKNGKGDLLQELREACDEYGLKMGVYLSPWDRNHADYGKPEYITYFRNQLRELLTNYGDIFEVWFDGANGGTGYYGGANEDRHVDRKTYYDWEDTYKIVRELQPKAVIFSDAGPDIRWVGNEEGYANETNWSLLRRDEVWPGWPHYKQLRSGHEDGTHWVPAECDVSIRPGWYYHASEDHKVKTLPELLDVYYNSIGRNGSFLLNFPVDKRGLIHQEDSAHVMQLASQLEKDFAHNLAAGKKVSASHERNQPAYAANKVNDQDPETYWAPAEKAESVWLRVDLGEESYINRFLVQEYIPLGQRVEAFTLEALENGQWKQIAEGTTIGYKRILRFPDVKTSSLRFTIQAAKASPLISNLAVYRAPKVLHAPTISRSKAGLVEIEKADPDALVYFTTDGSVPTKASSVNKGSFKFDKKGNVKAIVVDQQTGSQSPLATASFDISRAAWKLLQPKMEKQEVEAIWDGNPATSGGVKTAAGAPADWLIDLGAVYQLKGITYMPDQSRYASGILSAYQVFVSQDGRDWGEAVAEGEFSNIRNKPVGQEIHFPSRKARYIKLRPVKVLDEQEQLRIAEFGVITE